ncbi:MAG: hypothetical protein SVX43_08195 [Cyanobacteriota bacterium]|nr:hypothetical protein [Cyanobacteriota bacterium]
MGTRTEVGLIESLKTKWYVAIAACRENKGDGRSRFDRHFRAIARGVAYNTSTAIAAPT